MLLTKRQQDILEFLHAFESDQGIQPTLREIQSRFGFASSYAVQRHLLALERKGYIKRSGGRARAVSFVQARPRIGIPLLGAIPAGYPSHLDSSDPSGDVLEIDPASLGLPAAAQYFALKVRGNSMSGAMIADGDLAIIERNTNPSHGQIVAAVVDGEVTLKRFVVKNGHPILHAENPDYPDITPQVALEVQGILRSILRLAPSSL